MEQDTTYVAFDTSKETIAVAIAESATRKEVRFFGTIANRPDAVRKLVEKLAKRHGRLAFCYEAGPTGYGLLSADPEPGIRVSGRSSLDGAGTAGRARQNRSA